ncbi:YeiH family protein [Helicobacter sp. MIT 14-3879]|uniref:YeiH family protein n=1 Tax=Helicobacter sp. MIT 14-3879 TaxID=2040649 RepID=UPI000E1E7C26|nr:putative sulfate exporter family transporter [Helicobacter sp. MIT 14-3879]RDU64755.1 putative sulfate exporter family transporter [Helicobacter sp. MIT 14-3879]
MEIEKWYNKQDSWAIIIGLFLVITIAIFWNIGNIGIYEILRVKFQSWSGLNFNKSLPKDYGTHFIALYVFFSVWFCVVVYFLKQDIKLFLLGFSILFILSLFVGMISSNTISKQYQLESPLIALIIGLILSNFFRLPKWFEDSLLTEFYVKIGIVLMGATLPITLLLNAGGVAIIQACIITIITFFSIFFIATKVFKLDPSFGATLGAGGSICGVSAAIVIGNACKAKKEHVSVVISIVVVWAVIMVFVLPLLCRYLGLDMGVAGAWIGTSEFADAAGMAAAQSLGDDRATSAFTLIKVIGRDMFVGIWAVLVAFLSIAVWHKDSGVKVCKKDIWERFPKFILGFVIASLIITIFMSYIGEHNHKTFQKEGLGLIKELRNWVFTWTFLCIGLSTQFRKIIQVGYKPFLAFSIGVAINLPLGFILSQYIFVDFWTNFLKN